MKKILRKRTSFWGVLTITVAVAMVAAGLLAMNKPLPEYLVAKAALTAGNELVLEDLEVNRLDLGPIGAKYLDLKNFKEGLVVNELVLEGELLPLRNLSAEYTNGLTTIVLSPKSPVSKDIEPGSWVQVWRTVPSPTGFTSELLVERTQVIHSTTKDSVIGDVENHIEVFVSQGEAALLMNSMTSDFDIFLLTTS